MAPTKSRDNAGHGGNAVRDAVVDHNKLVTDFTSLRTQFVALLAKLDADAGVTDVNYAATLTPTVITATTVGNDSGTVIA